MRLPVFLTALALSLLALGSGCGKGIKATVTGTVTFDGKPLPLGTIAFTPKSGPGVSAQITDGTYTAQEVPGGDIRVTVDTATIKQERDMLFEQMKNERKTPTVPGAALPDGAKEFMSKQAAGAKDRAARHKELTAKYRFIPVKYASPETSGLTLNITSKEAKFDAALTK